jgi:hypothetical protein
VATGGGGGKRPRGEGLYLRQFWHERTHDPPHGRSLLLHKDPQASLGFGSKVDAATYCSTMRYAMVCRLLSRKVNRTTL